MSNSASAVVEEYLPKLEEVLTENVLDFWFPRCVDEEGGFLTSYDAKGAFAGNGHKQVVTQARTVWFTARLAREGYGEEYEEIAAHGLDFLFEQMWDEHGGFVWEFDIT